MVTGNILPVSTARELTLYQHDSKVYSSHPESENLSGSLSKSFHSCFSSHPLQGKGFSEYTNIKIECQWWHLKL